MQIKEGMPMHITIEVCCESAQDVIAAQEAGAHRVELNSALILGGLTPGIGTLRYASERTSIEILAMLRPRGGGCCYTDAEFAAMLMDLPLLLQNGAAGIVFGILTKEGKLDEKRCKTVLDAIGSFGKDKYAVFHKAFDAADQDDLAMLSQLFSLGFRRVLTSGRKKTAIEGCDNIRRYIDYLKEKGDRLEILPGGGVRPYNAEEILTKTGATQLHSTFHVDTSDGARTVDTDGLRAYVSQIENCQANSSLRSGDETHGG